MHLTHPLLLALATTATAVDVFFSCSGSTMGCRNLNPNQCCNGARADFTPEIGFYGIPTNWNLNCRGHSSGNCFLLKDQDNSNGRNFICLRKGFFSGAGYSFVGNNKRDVAGEAGAAEAECVKPDTVRFGDGVLYDIAGLAEDAVDKIMEIVNTGGNSSSVPAEFHALRL